MLAPGSPGYRALKIAVVGMGVLIVAGTVALAVLASGRMGGGSAQAAITLAEPQGTRIVTIATAGNRLAVHVTGGGPDRILLLDPDSLAITGRLTVTP